MLTFIAVCLGLLTVAHIAAAVVLIVTLLQVRRAAEAAEVVAYQAQDQVGRFAEAARKVEGLAGTLGSGWVKAGTAALGVLIAFWTARRRNG
ncbi:MAG: hypothetical protein HYV15_04150 [Elusimicrobia bacterium]|nr:hypothetical protein [Elusimicrobiota bacterium]